MRLFAPFAIAAGALGWPATASAVSDTGDFPSFPTALPDYGDSDWPSLFEILRHRVEVDPFNLVATIIFLLAIAHTFCAAKFLQISHRWNAVHAAKFSADGNSASSVCFKAEVMHFLGEVEAIFGIWVIPLLLAMILLKGWPVTQTYVGHDVIYTEPMFIVVIMCIAGTQPVLQFAEHALRLFANLGRGEPAAWWLSILTIGPLLGSVITEPAAMTICALLLARQFYELHPSARFQYATLGLLFVNISVGGALTHFAAPPVIMVSAKWEWGTHFMFQHFGWKAMVGIVITNTLYFLVFRPEFKNLRRAESPADHDGPKTPPPGAIPAWVMIAHLGALGWTVFTAHTPALFIGGFLFFLGFTIATRQHQIPLNIKPPILVGFFLGGLVVHAGLQGWWIEPVLGRLSSVPLLFGAMSLTAFNDNAAVTYLATLVPNFNDASKYAVVAGAIAGGGLTVIANAPNPAGQAILGRYFKGGINPLHLLLGALIPTAVMALCFLLLG